MTDVYLSIRAWLADHNITFTVKEAVGPVGEAVGVRKGNYDLVNVRRAIFRGIGLGDGCTLPRGPRVRIPVPPPASLLRT
jgi:hypothetical protein